jgi:hypothetical protein
MVKMQTSLMLSFTLEIFIEILSPINQPTIVINFHQDFVATTHSDFFQGQADRGLFYMPNHSWETQLSKQKEEELNPKVFF